MWKNYYNISCLKKEKFLHYELLIIWYFLKRMIYNIIIKREKIRWKRWLWIYFLHLLYIHQTCACTTSMNRSIFQAEFSTNISYHYYLILFFKNNFLIIVTSKINICIIQYLRLINDFNQYTISINYISSSLFK